MRQVKDYHTAFHLRHNLTTEIRHRSHPRVHHHISRTQRILQHPRMQCRSHHPRSEFSGGIAQTVHIMVKHSHHRARARCRTGSRTRRYIRPYYRHLTRHYPRHAAKQYTLAMRSVGKQRRSTRHRSPTVNLSQYIRKRSVTAVILYQVYRHCYHIAVKQRPHRRCRLTAQRKKSGPILHFSDSAISVRRISATSSGARCTTISHPNASSRLQTFTPALRYWLSV